jgi:hypothetical protein
MVAGGFFCMRFPSGRVGQAAIHGDFGGLPFWLAAALFRVMGLAGVALFGLVLAAYTYQAWFLIAHRDEVRRRRDAARLWS